MKDLTIKEVKKKARPMSSRVTRYLARPGEHFIPSEFSFFGSFFSFLVFPGFLCVLSRVLVGGAHENAKFRRTRRRCD